MSPDPAQRLEKMRAKLGLTLLNLMDPEAATASLYGVLNEEHGGIPHPTALVIDREGVIRYLRIDRDHTHRRPSSELLAVLEELPKEGD